MACTFLNILPRDGTSQPDRLREALQDTYVQIEERSPAEWLAFAEQLAVDINFYGNQNTIEADWKDFFETSLPNFEAWIARAEQQQDMPLHLALFVAFLRLLEILKKDLNALTYRHLDFYYRDYLGFWPKAAGPDRVHVLFELANNTAQYLLEAGAGLKAGKDDAGKALLYEIEKNMVLNRARVASLRTIYLDAENQSRVYMAPIADSLDGLGKDQGKEGVYWSPFGEQQTNLLPEQRSMVEAEIGFAIASPILLLREGARTITFIVEVKSYSLTDKNRSELITNGLPNYYSGDLAGLLDVDYGSEANFRQILVEKLAHQKSAHILPDSVFHSHINQILTEVNNPLRHLDGLPYASLEKFFTAYVSGEKDWFEVPALSVTKLGQNKLQFVLTIDPGQPALVAYDQTKLVGSLPTRFPVVRLVLNNANDEFLYPQIRRLQIVRTDIAVDVKGVRDLLLQNESAVLEPSGSFLPFGGFPTVGAPFYIGHYEVFGKRLDSLAINVEWTGLPNGFTDFAIHYAEYNPVKENQDFKVETALLHRRQWMTTTPDLPLFPTPLPNYLYPIPVPASLDRDFLMEPFTELGPNTKRGFLRLTLKSPDFGHSEFPHIYALAASNTPPPLPQPPYTPKIKSISLDYKSSIGFTPGQLDLPEHILHLEPYGSRPVEPDTSGYLLPQYPQGVLYIGLDGLEPPQNLSLLFQTLEGSGDPDYAITRNDVRWSVLSENRWLPLSSLQILEDATLGLQTSGILGPSIVREANRTHSLLPAGLRWLRAELDINPAGASKMVAVIAQAARAKFIDQGNDPAHYGSALPAGTITKFTESVGEIKKISQPFVSFGGFKAEQGPAFYTRVGERLRHKQRSSNLWDYEHLVLEAFPEVYKVKCINHYHHDEEIMPGKVTVALIPDLRQKNAIDPLKPRASSALRSRVHTYLEQYISPFIDLEVLNPLYEKIQLVFSVRFHAGYNGGFYARQLNEEIIRFLSPWAFEEGQDIVFGGQIYKAILLDFIEERPYVDFVTNFLLLHFRPGIGSECIAENFIIGPIVDIARATTARSILVSAASHTIHVLAPGEFPTLPVSGAGGIGQMVVEQSFSVV